MDSLDERKPVFTGEGNVLEYAFCKLVTHQKRTITGNQERIGLAFKVLPTPEEVGRYMDPEDP